MYAIRDHQATDTYHHRQKEKARHAPKKSAMIEDDRRRGCMGGLTVSPYNPRQAFTHVAGTPDRDQCSRWVLEKSASTS